MKLEAKFLPNEVHSNRVPNNVEDEFSINPKPGLARSSDRSLDIHHMSGDSAGGTARGDDNDIVFTSFIIPGGGARDIEQPTWRYRKNYFTIPGGGNLREYGPPEETPLSGPYTPKEQEGFRFDD